MKNKVYIVMACLSCNCSKGKMTEEEFKIYNNERKKENIYE